MLLFIRWSISFSLRLSLFLANMLNSCNIFMTYSLVLILAILLAPLRGDNSILDSLSVKMRNPSGVQLALTVRQSQAEQQWVDQVTMEILNPYQFIFYSSSVIIKVDNKSIYSFNPQTKQVVIDRFIQEDFILFKLITGNFNELKVADIKHVNGTTVIQYDYSELGYSGELKIDQMTYTPQQLTIEFGSESVMEATVEEFSILHDQPVYQKFNSLDGWEVIDLRE